jgi:phosphoglycerate-specific signal transduction histidine kinase
MEKNAELIAELERRARSTDSLAEGQRLFMEAARLRRAGRSTSSLASRNVTPLPRN